MDRTEFERRLQSIVVPEGTSASDLNRMVLPLREALIDMTLESLFRYRSCKEEHIDAFEKDKIYAVPADWFNDPYDTLVRYDYEGITKYVEDVLLRMWVFWGDAGVRWMVESNSEKRIIENNNVIVEDC